MVIEDWGQQNIYLRIKSLEKRIEKIEKVYKPEIDYDIKSNRQILEKVVENSKKFEMIPKEWLKRLYENRQECIQNKWWYPNSTHILINDLLKEAGMI